MQAERVGGSHLGGSSADIDVGDCLDEKEPYDVHAIGALGAMSHANVLQIPGQIIKQSELS
jgi:hypothetical protein